MPATEKELYRSWNEDQWYLVQEPGSNRVFVGRQSSLVDVRDFLSEGHGPQHEALLRLLENVEGP
jgi:hypothetical protein